MTSFNPNESFPWESTPSPGGVRGHAGSHGSVADPLLAHPHRPFPDPATGTLLVDPDITLKALGFDLEINLFYNSRSNANGAYGKKRSISTNAYLLKITSDFGNTVQLVRGDEKVYQFSEGSTGGGITTYNGINNQYSGTKLVWDSNTSEWIETFPDGKQIIYDENLGGTPQRWNIGRIEDPSDNIHTYTYGSSSEAGLLKTVEVPVGPHACRPAPTEST